MEDEKKSKKKNKKHMLVFLIVLLVLAILLASSYYKNSFKAMSKDSVEEKNVDIPAGSSTDNISNILKKEGIIRNKLIFKIATKKNGAQGKLKAGKFLLDTGMDLNEIISALVEGGKNENTSLFTIPEGYEIREIADKLKEEGLINRERFLDLTSNKKTFEKDHPILKELEEGQSLEGFLYPSTYEVYIGATEEEIINRMIDGFEEVYEKHIEEHIDNFDLSLNEIVTFASIVEKEARVDKERPIMAGVIYNRLDIDMPLQVDATVQYALEERKERLLYEDLKIESPYNTYMHKGLPPGPIASPGEKSLLAVINPKDVDYFFYVLKKDGSGEHIFNITYEEHKESQKD